MFELRSLDKTETGKPFEFTVDGEKFTLPPAGSMDWRVVDDLDKGRLGDAIRKLLSDADYQRFTALQLTLDELNGLFGEYAKHGNPTAGESSASTKS